MLLHSEKHFEDFTTKAIADSRVSSEAIVALAVESRREVDDMMRKALAAGAAPANDPQDHGFMYPNPAAPPA